MRSPSRKVQTLIVDCSLEMYALIFLSLATAMALQPCSDFCKRSSTSISNDTWRLDCICSEDSNYKIVKKPGNDENPVPIADDAIYYEPAEFSTVPNISIRYYPLVIFNPAFARNSFSEDEKSSKNISENTIHSESKLGTKYKRKDSHAYTLSLENKGSPIYLDIDIQNSPEQERSSRKHLSSIENVQVTEMKLKDCIDLHLLIHLRNKEDVHGQKANFNVDRFEKYNNLSNADLMIEIENRCTEAKNVVKQSLREIKKSQSRKNSIKFQTLQDSQQENKKLSHDILNSDKELGSVLKSTSSSLHETIQKNNVGTDELASESRVSNKEAISRDIISNIKFTTTYDTNNSIITTTERSRPKIISTRSTAENNFIKKTNNSNGDIDNNKLSTITPANNINEHPNDYSNEFLSDYEEGNLNSRSNEVAIPISIINFSNASNDISITENNSLLNIPSSDDHVNIKTDKDKSEYIDNLPELETNLEEHHLDDKSNPTIRFTYVSPSDTTETLTSSEKDIHSNYDIETMSQHPYNIQFDHEGHNSDSENLTTIGPLNFMNFTSLLKDPKTKTQKSKATPLTTTKISTNHYKENMPSMNSYPDLELNTRENNFVDESVITIDPVSTSKASNVTPTIDQTAQPSITYDTNRILPGSYVNNKLHLTEDYATNDYIKTNVSIVTNQVNRTLYPESEIEIPKIEVKDSDNITTSKSTGFELLPNSDFTNEKVFSVTTLSKTTESKDKNAVTELPPYPPMAEHNEAVTKKSEISGNLYFLFEDVQVPARFVQNPDGKINLGLDAHSLCDKLTTDHSSILFSIMCNCAKFSNCTNVINNDNKNIAK